VNLKVVPKAGHESTQKKVDQGVMESPNINLMWLLERFLELVSAFKEASKNFYVYFSHE
jgi:hypothetical protein